jgi:hypothetical protein
MDGGKNMACCRKFRAIDDKKCYNMSPTKSFAISFVKNYELL